MLNASRLRLLLVLVLVSFAAVSSAAPLEDALKRFKAATPVRAVDFANVQPATFVAGVQEIDKAAAEVGLQTLNERPEAVSSAVLRLLDAKQAVDRLLQQTLALRTDFAAIQPVEKQRAALRNYLRVDSQLIELSGRLRYLQFDAFNSAAGQVAGRQADRDKFIDTLTKWRSSIGAEVMSELLFDPPADTDGKKPTEAERSQVLKLIAASNQYEVMPRLAKFINDKKISPALVLQTAETIRSLGLPQDARPGADPILPKPVINAKQLHEILTGLQLPANDKLELAKRRDTLVTWLNGLVKEGITDDHYRLGAADVRPGDWLLMRNPSPYNLFTDLSPGLFTHVGIVTMETGPDGIRRMVVVDMPEPGNRMPATNIDIFVMRTRHYVLLRHEDPTAAAKMAAVARSVIGNETQFDLSFRTDRVAALKGQPLEGKKIVTYCAGLLFLAAQETGLAREDFFPIPEYAAAGYTAENLAQLGMSFSKDFISPTIALFSSHMKIIGQREPMYDAKRQIDEAVYDYFAESMKVKKLKATPDTFQALRMKVAEAAKGNSALAQALAAASGVNEDTDLVSAARARAVIDTLDEVAYGASADYLWSQQAMRAPVAKTLDAKQFTKEQIALTEKLQKRHPTLYDAWGKEQISPRTLRIELVKYYIAQGKGSIDQRFFGISPPPIKEPVLPKVNIEPRDNGRGGPQDQNKRGNRGMGQRGGPGGLRGGRGGR